MVDHIVDASERGSRVDIRVGVERRRRWRAEDKGRIVAESYAAGAVVSEVARRHEITPQHLFALVSRELPSLVLMLRQRCDMAPQLRAVAGNPLIKCPKAIRGRGMYWPLNADPSGDMLI